MHLDGFHDLRIDAFFRQDPGGFEAMDGQIPPDPLKVEIVQQPRQAPFVLILSQTVRERPHDGLRGVAVVEHAFILYMLLQQRNGFVSGHGHVILPGQSSSMTMGQYR
jgi:hypothetical protein